MENGAQDFTTESQILRLIFFVQKTYKKPHNLGFSSPAC